MKSKSLLTLTAACLFFATQSFAASADECAIWSCLPDGFGAECGNAYAAFKDRLRSGQAPLPPKNQCIGYKNTTKDFDFRVVPAAFLPATDTKEARWVEGALCQPKFGKGPKGCIKQGKAISVTNNKQTIGDVFYTK